jgi:hypothetical protein
MKYTIGIIVWAFAIVASGCGDKSMRPTEPDPVPSFTGTWIGTSRVISCEPSSGGCVNYPVGHERYLDFRLTQSGDDVTGNLSPVKGGPLAARGESSFSHADVRHRVWRDRETLE